MMQQTEEQIMGRAESSLSSVLLSPNPPSALDFRSFRAAVRALETRVVSCPLDSRRSVGIIDMSARSGTLKFIAHLNP